MPTQKQEQQDEQKQLMHEEGWTKQKKNNIVNANCRDHCIIKYNL